MPDPGSSATISTSFVLLAGLGQNMALALALCFMDEQVHARLGSRPGELRRCLVMGLMFAGIALIGMQVPTQVAPGVAIDARVVLVTLAGAFYGYPAAAVVAMAVCGYRIHLGGAGTLAGVLAVIQGAALGTALHVLVGNRPERIRTLHLLSVGVATAIGSLLCTFALPVERIWSGLTAMTPAVSIAYPIATVALGSLIGMQFRSRLDRIELSASRDRLALAAKSAQLGIWDWDIEHDQLLWDEGMLRIYSIAPGQFNGTYDAWASRLHPADRERAEAELRNALATSGEFESIFRIVSPQGEIRHIRASSKAFRGADGKLLRMVGVNEDITERKTTEEELDRHRNRLEQLVAERTASLNLVSSQAETARQEAESARALAESALADSRRMEASYRQAKVDAEQANRAKSDFLASMSHEIRTPLNAVLGYAQLLGRDPALGKTQRESVEVINRSGEHLLQLMNDILEMSRIESGRTVSEVQDVDLHDLLDITVAIFRQRSIDKGLRLDLELAGDLPRFIRTDARMVRQILLNLLSNAVKFTERGAIGLAASMHTGMLTIRIRDTGAGIAPTELPDLFRPFVQAEAGRKHGDGTGLGLAISLKFARLLNGDLSVESRPGIGSCFTLYLPVLRATSAVMQPSRLNVVGPAPGERTPRLLIAEDHADSRTLLTEMLRTSGCLVVSVGNGDEAVSACRRERFDLVWMDIDMPVLDGMAAAAAIRNLPGPTPKLAALTAAAFAEDQQRLLAGGFDAVAIKPFREDELFRIMERLLGIHFTWKRVEPGSSGEPVLPDEAIHDRLRLVPASEIAALSDAVLTGDLDAGSRQLANWRDRVLAKALTRMLDAYAMDQVLGLLTKIPGTPGDPSPGPPTLDGARPHAPAA
ncbi:hypothetical protein LBMAG53_08900 [Planctomycetota bacterium]|nr:hypothetical protein LBMAG53_08900 [Planctomycetota bacterium]